MTFAWGLITRRTPIAPKPVVAVALTTLRLEDRACHRMVEGREDLLHTTEAEHHGTLEQRVPHRSLPMGAPTATGQSLDLEGWSYDHRRKASR
jgi:hypothetical protein